MLNANGSPFSDPTETTDDDQARQAADLYTEQVQAFRMHAGAFAAGMIVTFGVNLATNLAAGIADHWSAWWAVWALPGWGIGITVHGFVVRLARPHSSAALQARQPHPADLVA